MALTIHEVKLANFRNYKELSLCNLENLTVFVGPNAIGKTNIIEAIQLTTLLSSMKNATIEQLIQWGTSYASIETRICDLKRDLIIKLEMSDEKKTYYLNGKTKRPKELRGLLPSVSFTPDDLVLIKGPQSVKRKTLDIFGSQTSANYQTIKKDYEKILRHKNSLLKEERGFSPDMLSAINETLITTGVQFYLYRRSLLLKMIPFIQKHYEIIAHEKEEVKVIYLPSWSNFNDDYIDTFDKEAITQKFRKALTDKADEEYRRRHALVGPHADKIEFRIDGKDAEVYGSQGQQRSLVLSFKLAEVEVIQELTNQKPVLLLDDVMSELDKERRESLLSFIQDDVQTFITTTHLEYFPKQILEQARIIDLSLIREGGSYEKT